MKYPIDLEVIKEKYKEVLKRDNETYDVEHEEYVEKLVSLLNDAYRKGYEEGSIKRT